MRLPIYADEFDADRHAASAMFLLNLAIFGFVSELFKLSADEKNRPKCVAM